MHKTSFRPLRLAMQALAAAWFSGLSFPAGAGPIVLQEAKQPADAMVDTSKLVTLEQQDPLPVAEVLDWDKSRAQSNPTPESLKPGVASVPSKSTPTAQPDVGPSLSQDLRSSIKETVRPVYDQLVDSGAVEALHDVKENLGLNKDPWGGQDKPSGAAKISNQWDTPDAALPPRTAAQAQMDRELAGVMRAKLINQLTPWVAGLVGLYLLGWLIKLLFGYVQWKSARRNERQIQRAKRQTAHRSHSSGARTAPSPLGATRTDFKDSSTTGARDTAGT